MIKPRLGRQIGKMSLLTGLEFLGAGFLQRWRAYGAAENSPAIYGWVKASHKNQSPGGTAENPVAVRKDLSSLTGLGIWADENPRLKPWAIFKNHFRRRGDADAMDERGGHKLIVRRLL